MDYIKLSKEELIERIIKLEKEKDFTDKALSVQLDTFFVFDVTTGEAVKWNKIFEDVSGYSSEEIKSMKAPDSYYSAEELIKAEKFINEVLKNGSGTTELNLVCKNGNLVPTQYAVSILNDSEGNPKYFISIGRDISEKIKAEDKLRKSEIKFRRLADSAPDIIYYFKISPTIGFDFISPAVTKISGYTPEEYYNDPELGPKIIHPDDREDLVKLLKGIVPEGPHIVRWIKKDGKVIWVEDRMTPIYNDKNELIAIEGIARDITETKLAEEKLIESEEKFRVLFEDSKDSIFITTSNGNFLTLNKTAVDLFGYTKEEVMKMNVVDLYYNPEDRLKFRETIEQNDFVKDYKISLKNKSGQKIDCLLSATVRKDEEGKIIGYQGSYRDITKEKMTEQQLILAKEKAEKADRLKSEFLAQMSHEIRTPINAILSFSNLLKSELNELVPEEMEDSFDIMDNAGRRIIRTIDLILNMSEMQTGTYKPSIRRIDLFEEILIPLSTQYNSICKSKGLDLIVSNIYGNSFINGDEYTITQIFDNLLGNAVKYTMKGKIEIVGNHVNDKTIIDIIDTGVGISEEYLPDLFLPFTQEEQGYTRKYEGSGLGLSLVQKYCELNNAEIHCESEKGKGSKFSVAFIQK